MAQSPTNLQNYTVNNWRPFSKKLYLYAWRDSYLWGVIRQFFQDIKYCYQRALYGYCDYDLYSIYDWFLDIMPRMLKQFKETRHGSPVMTEYPDGVMGTEKEAELYPVWEKAWDDTLDRMIFLFRESSEETCGRENPYEQEHDQVWHEFEEKYGFLGEKLETEEERQDKKPGKRAHFPNELPEYEEIEKNYSDEERKIEEYREKCKKEAFELFSKWFYNLWD